MYRKLHASILAISSSLALVTASPLLAEIIVPEGDAGTALRLTDDLRPIGRINGLGNVHGMDVAITRGLLVSGSVKGQKSGAIAKPEKMTKDAHAAHHMKGGKSMGDTVGIVSLIDIASGEVTRRIEVPGAVHHVTVGAKDRLALVTHPMLGAISLIDLETSEVTATIQTGPNPNYAVFDDRTGMFLVSNAGNGTISVVDPAAGYVVRNIKTPGAVEHMVIDVQGRRLFGAEVDTGLVDVVNLDTGVVAKSFDVGGKLHGIAWVASTDTLFVSVRSKGQIARINLAESKISRTSVGPKPYHMALNGTTLLVSSAKQDVVWSFDTKDLTLLGEAQTAARGHQMVVLPNS